VNKFLNSLLRFVILSTPQCKDIRGVFFFYFALLPADVCFLFIFCFTLSNTWNQTVEEIIKNLKRKNQRECLCVCVWSKLSSVVKFVLI